MEFGEAARDALEREIQEELGRSSKAGRFLGVIEHSFRQKGKAKSEISLLFLLTIPGLRPSRPVQAAEPKLTFKWISLSKLAGVRLEPAPLRTTLSSWLRRSGSGWAGTIRRKSRDP